MIRCTAAVVLRCALRAVGWSIAWTLLFLLYFLIGAIVVIPIWLIVRLISGLRGDTAKKSKD